MSSVSKLTQDEQVFWASSSPSGSNILLCLGQKNMLNMKELIRKFTLPGGVVVDCCAVTSSGAKACMLQLQHRQFVGNDLDLECIASSPPRLTLIFARRVLKRVRRFRG